MNKYKENKESSEETYYEYMKSNGKSTCTVYLKYPENYKSEMTFVGLFKTPIPNHAPIIGKAVIPKKVNNRCTFKNIPDGKYYILACSVEKTGKFSDTSI